MLAAPGNTDGTSDCVMPLAQMQRDLEHLNDVQSAFDVRDFLFTDRNALCELAPTDFSTERPEALLVAETDDGMELSLFIDADIIDTLTARRTGDDGYCAALEGVSHFLYLTWNAEHGRSVSALDMELQAEVDKYAMCLLAQADQGSAASARLREQLFTELNLRESLQAEERARYLEASELAQAVSGWLESRYLNSLGAGALVGALRRFYRLPRQRKLASARACAAQQRRPLKAP